MKKLLFILLVIVSIFRVNSQTLSQTNNSNSSLLLGNNIDKSEYLFDKTLSQITNSDFEVYIPSQLSINVATKDKMLTVENLYNFQIKKTNNFLILGINGSGKINNSIASILENSNIVGGFSGNLLLGFKFFRIKNETDIYNAFVDKIKKIDKDDKEILKKLKQEIGNLGQIEGHWFYINPSIEGRKFKNYFPSNNFDSQIVKENKSLWALNIGYNYWSPNIYGFNSILGVSYTPKFTDNFSELTEFSLVEQQTATNNIIQRVSSSKTTVYSGEYKTSHKQDLNFETYLVHNKMPNFGLYLGYLNTFEKNIKTLTTFSTGLYFSKPKQPTNPSIGIVVNFNDINDNFNLDSDKKFSINLVTRLNIGSVFK
ncbi:MAG: hypothetical protein V3U92_04525 [Cellulophaga sp.]